MQNYNQTLQTNNSSLEEIITQLNNMPDAGSSDPVLQDKTVTPTTSQQIISADGGYDGLDTVTVNAIPTTTQATPSITINSSGLITATATQSAGYVIAGTKSATKQLAFQAAKTITPTTVNQTAVSSGYYTGGAVTVKGDTNLVASNIKSGVSIFGVNGTYVGSGSSGEMTEYSEAEDAIISRTISGTYTNDRVETIGSHAFEYCSSLTSVNFPRCTDIGSFAFSECYSLTSMSFPMCSTISCGAFNDCSSLTSVSFSVCTSIGSIAFYYCRSLTSVNFPKCTIIGSSAFGECYSLTTVSFPECWYIGEGAFANCSSLTSVSFPECTSISYYAFEDCSSLTSVSFPKCRSIGNLAFRWCSSLTSVSFPECTSIGDYVFNWCSSLTSVSFPKCTSIGNWVFRECYSLTTVSFPECTTIGNYAFYLCSSLSEIYLTSTSVCTLSHSNAFTGTGIRSTKGSIFVPSSLVTSYQSATNWTYFSNRIFGV